MRKKIILYKMAVDSKSLFYYYHEIMCVGIKSHHTIMNSSPSRVNRAKMGMSPLYKQAKGKDTNFISSLSVLHE